MKKEIPAYIHSFDFPEGVDVPHGTDDCIFIPCLAKDSVTIFFFIDFKTKRIIAFEINLSDEMTRLKEAMGKYHVDNESPHRMPFDTLVYSISLPHQGEIYRQTVIVSFIALNFFVLIDLKALKVYLLFDETRETEWIYSSTNQIRGGKMYAARWRFKDMYKAEVASKKNVDLEIIQYDIDADEFHLIDTIAGVVHIHTTNITPDGRFLLLVEMNTDSILDTPNLSQDPEERQIEIQSQGIVDSDCYIYDLEKKRVASVERLPINPAHAEFDSEDPGIFFLSQHNLCVMGRNNRVYSFGPAIISKYRLTENGRMQRLKEFLDKETVRIPGHTLFSFKGKQLMAMPVTPLQIFIVDRDTMTIQKKIGLRDVSKKPDFEKGPLPLSMPLRDPTPFSVHAKNESRYLYCSNILSIGVYDFLDEKYVCDFKFNPGFRILNGGHASRFQGVKMQVDGNKTYEQMTRHSFKKPLY